MKNLSKEEEYIRQYISELGSENPSEGFHKSTIGKLRSTQPVSVYKPVISSLGWKMIGGAIAILVISILLFMPYGANTSPLFNQLTPELIPQLSIILPKIALPSLDLSASVVQSLLVFTLLIFITIITTLKKWDLS